MIHPAGYIDLSRQANLGRSFLGRIEERAARACFGPYRWPWWKRVYTYWKEFEWKTPAKSSSPQSASSSSRGS